MEGYTMQTKTTTRRAVLAGIAAATALAGPALALSGPDPIFDKIEAHRAAPAAHLVAC
jgi:hypothetical protein